VQNLHFYGYNGCYFWFFLTDLVYDQMNEGGMQVVSKVSVIVHKKDRQGEGAIKTQW
jgi:hypothetical protein